MQFELPDFKRCCLCIPVRHGILIFGYLNLLFTLFLLCLEAYLDFGYHPSINTFGIFRGVEIYAQLWFHFVLYSFDIIFNIVLLIGAHTKHIKLIRVYFYYGIVTMVASTLILLLVTFSPSLTRTYFLDAVALSLAFCSFTLQGYLLLLIRTEMQKLKYREGHSYVNHMSEVVLRPPPV